MTFCLLPITKVVGENGFTLCFYRSVGLAKFKLTHRCLDSSYSSERATRNRIALTSPQSLICSSLLANNGKYLSSHGIVPPPVTWPPPAMEQSHILVSRPAHTTKCGSSRVLRGPSSTLLPGKAGFSAPSCSSLPPLPASSQLQVGCPTSLLRWPWHLPDASRCQSNWFIWPVSPRTIEPLSFLQQQKYQIITFATAAPDGLPTLCSAVSAHTSGRKPSLLQAASSPNDPTPSTKPRNTKQWCRGWDGPLTDQLGALHRHLVLIKIIFFLSVFLSRLKKRSERNLILEWFPNKFPFPQGQVFFTASSGNLQQFIKKRQLYLWPISCIIQMSSEVLESSLYLKCLEAL